MVSRSEGVLAWVARRYERFDQGYGHLVAIHRTRTRDARAAAYVDAVRSAEAEPEPDAALRPRDREQDMGERMPASVERALPRETRSGPAGGGEADDREGEAGGDGADGGHAWSRP